MVVNKILSQTGILVLNPLDGLGGLTPVLSDPLIIRTPKWGKDRVANIHARLKIVDFDGATAHIFMSRVDSLVYPAAPSLTGGDGWTYTNYVPPFISQSANGTTYTRHLKGTPVGTAFRFGILLQYAAGGLGPFDIDHELEVWVEH